LESKRHLAIWEVLKKGMAEDAGSRAMKKGATKRTTGRGEDGDRTTAIEPSGHLHARRA
jgi:hypothetical protein